MSRLFFFGKRKIWSLESGIGNDQNRSMYKSRFLPSVVLIIQYLILSIKCRVLDRSRPVDRLSCVDAHLWRDDHRFTRHLIFPQQVEEANSRSWKKLWHTFYSYKKGENRPKTISCYYPFKVHSRSLSFIICICVFLPVAVKLSKDSATLSKAP
jgi:hypothetical protein